MRRERRRPGRRPARSMSLTTRRVRRPVARPAAPCPSRCPGPRAGRPRQLLAGALPGPGRRGGAWRGVRAGEGGCASDTRPRHSSRSKPTPARSYGGWSTISVRMHPCRVAMSTIRRCVAHCWDTCRTRNPRLYPSATARIRSGCVTDAGRSNRVCSVVIELAPPSVWATRRYRERMSATVVAESVASKASADAVFEHLRASGTDVAVRDGRSWVPCGALSSTQLAGTDMGEGAR